MKIKRTDFDTKINEWLDAVGKDRAIIALRIHLAKKGRANIAAPYARADSPSHELNSLIEILWLEEGNNIWPVDKLVLLIARLNGHIA